jgi:hypothetical protein
MNNTSLNISESAKNYKEENKQKAKNYYQENKEKKLNYQKQYYQENKEKILEKKRLRANKKVNCECKGKYTICHKTRHLRSKKHQTYLLLK